MNFEDMTAEQRLKQIEILLSTAAKTINLTTERSERNAAAIERNAAAIERNAAAIERNAVAIERNAVAIERLSDEGLGLRLTMDRLSEYFTESVRIIRQQQANIEKMQSEIRGLQVENQRILHRVFGDSELDQP